MIIDVHVHTMPRGDREPLALLRRECRRCGVSLMLASSIGQWSRFPPVEEVAAANEEARDFAERSDGLAKWLVYVNPQNDNWGDELQRGRAGGAVGVKLWVSLKDAAGRLDGAAAAVRRAAELDLPVLIHTYHRTNYNPPGEITLAELADLAAACPRARLIGAHAGGNWRHAIGVLRGRAGGACVDISGSFPEKGMVEALVGDLGADRVVFGSDMPGRSLPSQLAKVVFADITEDQKRQILCENAARIFGLPLEPPETPAPPAPAEPLRPDAELPDLREDHFCFCGRWPFFETPCATPAELDDLLAAEGIERAYAADLGSVYRIDLEEANRRYLQAAAPCRCVAPLAALNPLAHNWRALLRHWEGRFAGAIVYPYLHDWRLDDPAHREFFRRCADRRIGLWINCALGDERLRHSGVAARRVSADELVAFAAAAPDNAYVFQGVGPPAMAALRDRLPDDRRFRFEISRLTDQTGALDDHVNEYGLRHLVMGSELPLRDLRTVPWTARRQ